MPANRASVMQQNPTRVSIFQAFGVRDSVAPRSARSKRAADVHALPESPVKGVGRGTKRRELSGSTRIANVHGRI